jgi:hypothetical protein
MRPSLLRPRGQRRHSRRERHSHSPVPSAAAASTAASAEPAATHNRDAAVARVREAGGPLDQASYACSCGFLFRAAVSTSVSCPHCGMDQAW